jgi:hypothetical protein
MLLLTVHSGSGLEEGALWVIAHVYGEAGPHGVVRGAAAALQISRLQGQFCDVRVVQGVADSSRTRRAATLKSRTSLLWGDFGVTAQLQKQKELLFRALVTQKRHQAGKAPMTPQRGRPEDDIRRFLLAPNLPVGGMMAPFKVPCTPRKG